MTFVLQGRPVVILGPDLERPATWPSMSAAITWATERPTRAMQAADSIVVVDVATGESEYL